MGKFKFINRVFVNGEFFCWARDLEDAELAILAHNDDLERRGMPHVEPGDWNTDTVIIPKEDYQAALDGEI